MDLDSITAANQRNSPLLRLPAELRNKIYLYVFDANYVYLTQKVIRRDFLGPRIPPYPMSLAQACTQCRHEALPYFWQKTNFVLMYDSVSNLVRHTSQSLRDQVEVVWPSYGVVRCLWLSENLHGRAFGDVKKIVFGFKTQDERYVNEEFLGNMKKTFGEDAELVDRDGKSYLAK